MRDVPQAMGVIRQTQRFNHKSVEGSYDTVCSSGRAADFTNMFHVRFCCLPGNCFIVLFHLPQITQHGKLVHKADVTRMRIPSIIAFHVTHTQTDHEATSFKRSANSSY